MKRVKEFNQVTRESKLVTYINVIEKNREGIKTQREMKLRHALQAMRVQPERFTLAPGEKLPKGISVDMVPAGTTMDDVEQFELTRGTLGKVSKTKFDNVLDALEQGLEIQDAVNIEPTTLRSGSMKDETAPKNYKPTGVDLIPAESMKEKSTEDEDKKLQAIADENKVDLSDEEKVLDKTAEEQPALKELKEKELKFEAGADATSDYTKESLKDLENDKLQAIMITLPGFEKLSEKMKKVTIKANKAGLVSSIVQLSKRKK